MSYQVIARKYRPQRFADVVGQDHVIQTLTNAIAQGRIAHAFLFCGPRGTGKTTIARIFAKALNCTGGPKVDFDESDPRCLEITEGRSMDVLEIDGASNNGVEQVRELRETCRYAPANSKFKIYIIDEVHMLTAAAFNALLKTLEEPPAHVKFMFATTDPEKVLPTILSRCQRFDLRRIPNALIVKHLAHIARQERVRIEETALLAIARGADGGMRDAESTLDQLISFCGEEIVENDVLSMFGLAAQGQILALARAILAGEPATALEMLDTLARNGKDLGRLLSDLLEHFRNLLLFQVSKGDPRLLSVSEAEVQALKQEAHLAPTEAVTRIMEVLSDGEWRLREAVSRRIALEVTLMKAIEAREAVPIDTLLRHLNDWRGQGGTNQSAATPATRRSAPPASRVSAPAPVEPAPSAAPNPKAPPTHPAVETPVPVLTAAAPPPPTAAPAAAVSGAADLPTLWGELVEAIGRVSLFTRGYLIEAHPVSFEKRLFVIGFDPEFAEHLSFVDNAKNHTLIQTKLAEMGHPGCQVKFIKADAPKTAPRPVKEAPAASVPAAKEAAKPAPTAPANAPQAATPAASKPAPARPPMSKAEFMEDPLIRKALEIFKGQITEVRS